MAGALSAELGGTAEMEAPKPCARHLCWLAERLSCVGRGATTRARGRRVARGGVEHEPGAAPGAQLERARSCVTRARALGSELGSAADLM